MGSMLSEAEGNTGVNKQENRSKDRLLNKCKGKKGKKKRGTRKSRSRRRKKKQHLPLRGDVFKRLSQKTGEVRGCDH